MLLLTQGACLASDEELTERARNIPVPRGVLFVSEEHSENRVETLWEERERIVVRYYKTELNCGELLAKWKKALDRKGLNFEVIESHDPNDFTMIKLETAIIQLGEFSSSGDPARSLSRTLCSNPFVVARDA